LEAQPTFFRAMSVTPDCLRDFGFCGALRVGGVQSKIGNPKSEIASNDKSSAVMFDLFDIQPPTTSLIPDS